VTVEYYEHLYGAVAKAAWSGGPNAEPSATITTPAAGTTWAVGDTISFAGSATDPEDGDLPRLHSLGTS